MIINFFPAGATTFASTRLRVWKISEALTKLGHRVLFGNYLPCDVAVFQKVYRLDIMRHFKEKGIRTIFDMDDWIPTLIPDVIDQITVDTPTKLQLFPGAVVVPDALDVNDDSPLKTEHRPQLESAVWVGNTENMYHVQNAARACHACGIKLTLVTDLRNPHFSEQVELLPRRDATWEAVQWDIETVDSIMIQHDLAIFPFMFDGKWSPEWVKSKSANRMLKAHALGLPVVATPIPSYNVEVGLTLEAQTVEQWCAALNYAQDLVWRRADAKVGFDIAQQFRADKVVLQWLEVFKGE